MSPGGKRDWNWRVVLPGARPESAPALVRRRLHREAQDASVSKSWTGSVWGGPWIDLILAGEKTGRLRSWRASTRRHVALAQGGSDTLVGACRIVDGPRPAGLVPIRSHAVTPWGGSGALAQEPLRQTFAWVLGSAKPRRIPLPCRQTPGAVLWVRLSRRIAADVATRWRGTGGPGDAAVGRKTQPAALAPPGPHALACDPRSRTMRTHVKNAALGSTLGHACAITGPMSRGAEIRHAHRDFRKPPDR
jgi:hypothetical protein